MRKILATLFTFGACALSVDAQAYYSDLAATTLTLNSNEIDWVAGPNEAFNTLSHDYLIGSFDNRDGTLGYYKGGNLPVSAGVSFNYSNTLDATTMDTSATTSDEYEHPLVNSWNTAVFATVGFKKANDLSVGVRANFYGTDDGYTVNPSVGNTISYIDKTSNIDIFVPFGLSLGKMYNYGVVAGYMLSVDYDDNATQYKKDEFVGGFYDKLTMPSLLPGGTETSFYASYYFPRTTTYDPAGSTIETSGAIGAENRFDKKIAEGISLAFKPGLNVSYSETLDKAASQKDTEWDIALYCPLAFNAKFPGTPITLYAGAEPYAYLSLAHRTVTTGGLVTESDGSDFYSTLYRYAMGGLTVEMPGDVKIDFTVISGTVYSLECVIPFK